MGVTQKSKVDKNKEEKMEQLEQNRSQNYKEFNKSNNLQWTF